MVKNQKSLLCDLDQAVRLRREAYGLLRRLETHRAANEQVSEETGKRDAMRAITGRTAIEDAIEETRGMIRRMDDLLNAAADEVVGLRETFETHHAGTTEQLVEAQ